MTTPSNLFHIRPATPDDIPFLYHSWLKSYRDSPMVKSIPNTIYYAAHHALIERILLSDTRIILIACNPDDHNQIYGYVVGQPTVIHWVYTKHPFRRNGIGAALVEACKKESAAPTVFFTHRVKGSKEYERRLEEAGLTFNPYLLYALKGAA